MRADTVVTNADIWTMDPLTPRAAALAIRDGRVCALGTAQDIQAHLGPRTEVIDAGGRMVLPGLQDTHIHIQDSGYYRGTMADLTTVKTIPELQSALAEFGRTRQHGWLLGIGWYTGLFSEDNLDRLVLDAVSPDRPCMILSSDMHSGCLNSRAVALIGLTAETADPPNGVFVRTPSGTPTGMLHEEAIYWAQARIPPVTDEDYADGVRFAQSLCHRHGLTGALDPSASGRHARVYAMMEARGDLALRLSSAIKVDPAETTESAVARLSALRQQYQGPLFKVHSAKFYLDGVLENRTAAMIDGYQDAAGGNAPLMFTPAQINDMFTAFDANRFQIHVHVIGDLATRAALDGLQAALDANGPWPSLHQLTHIECIDPADIPRFGQFGCVANIQAFWARHAPSVIDVAVPMAGLAKAPFIYAFRSLLDTGALWTLTSDWGVSTLNPFQIMETAITRQPPGRYGQHPVFLEQQRITREESVKGYTVNAAAAAWRQMDTGRLGVGCHGDLAILDRDIMTCDVYDIGDTEVQLTLLGGREVYRASGFGG
jgi:predicted amidohydrolase YtcJ